MKIDLFETKCGLLYSFMPPGRGRVFLSLTSYTLEVVETHPLGLVQAAHRGMVPMKPAATVSRIFTSGTAAFHRAYCGRLSQALDRFNSPRPVFLGLGMSSPAAQAPDTFDRLRCAAFILLPSAGHKQRAPLASRWDSQASPYAPPIQPKSQRIRQRLGWPT